jgi:D-amino-acid dehydrogenase
MRVLVLGAGVAGVTAAYELLQDGHEVTVLERHAEPACETSFANAGLVAPGHAYAWASPRAPGILLRSLVLPDQPLRFRLRPDPAMWRWAAKFLGQCTAERARRNTERKHRLCRYAQSALQNVVVQTGVAYDGERRGLLYLYRDPARLAGGIASMRILEEAGQALEVIDRDRAIALDPALAPARARIAGGIFCPTDESGDACKFTRALAAWCAARGVRFRYGAMATGFELDGDRLIGVRTDQGNERADAFVLALGCASPQLVRQLGETVSVYPIKGYSVTLPVRPDDQPPAMGGVDEDNLFAYVRMGERVRFTAVAEFAGYDTSHRPADFAGLLRAARELLPAAGDYAQPSYWACLRPMTPEGTPVLGTGRYANLFYNTGHGHMGWTMACGTARITADLIAGRRPDLPLDGMTLR